MLQLMIFTECQAASSSTAPLQSSRPARPNESQWLGDFIRLTEKDPGAPVVATQKYPPVPLFQTVNYVTGGYGNGEYTIDASSASVAAHNIFGVQGGNGNDLSWVSERVYSSAPNEPRSYMGSVRTTVSGVEYAGE